MLYKHFVCLCGAFYLPQYQLSYEIDFRVRWSNGRLILYMKVSAKATMEGRMNNDNDGLIDNEMYQFGSVWYNLWEKHITK